ncbi:hypothetical protein FTUN_8749 [Frigoriglobus tundricola]|uniref:Uncharacterized protein n=1 Tax=Frigoriglobus tundricola TaxID=2774151 RepID=A0A6M5Z3W1_9BACT|nr:hypothetical protein FTUN_8749 [Frigoriglobus tundricola]
MKTLPARNAGALAPGGTGGATRLCEGNNRLPSVRSRPAVKGPERSRSPHHNS